MLARRWMNDASSLESDDETPLVRAMRKVAQILVHGLVVRSPVDRTFTPEIAREGEHGPVHEVVTRWGLRVRGPFALLRRPQRPALAPANAETDTHPSRA